VPSSPEKPLTRALVWLRRDLRADDNAALYHALAAAKQVWVSFVFDRVILGALPRADRRRVHPRKPGRARSAIA
jgi:deoxyribodipyrimidine photo-lyase